MRDYNAEREKPPTTTEREYRAKLAELGIGFRKTYRVFRCSCAKKDDWGVYWQRPFWHCERCNGIARSGPGTDEVTYRLTLRRLGIGFRHVGKVVRLGVERVLRRSA